MFVHQKKVPDPTKPNPFFPHTGYATTHDLSNGTFLANGHIIDVFGIWHAYKDVAECYDGTGRHADQLDGNGLVWDFIKKKKKAQKVEIVQKCDLSWRDYSLSF